MQTRSLVYRNWCTYDRYWLHLYGAFIDPFTLCVLISVLFRNPVICLFMYLCMKCILNSYGAYAYLRVFVFGWNDPRDIHLTFDQFNALWNNFRTFGFNLPVLVIWPIAFWCLVCALYCNLAFLAQLELFCKEKTLRRHIVHSLISFKLRAFV